MKFLETKHQRNSAKITALIVFILVLLMFVVGPPYMDPPLEYGVAVNFGSSDVGSGTIQPKAPLKSAPKERIQTEEVIPSSRPVSTIKSATEDEVLTQDNEETLALKAKADAEAKRIAEQEAKAKAEAERLRKQQEKQNQQKQKLDALMGGISSSEGSESGSEGDDNALGDKGQLDGNPYAPSYFGSPGSGNGGLGYGLNGRGRPSRSKVIPDCDEEGTVVVEIQVNRNGDVVSATAGKQGTTGDLCLYEAAKKTALTHKWPADNNAPYRQIGFVIVDFSVSQ